MMMISTTFWACLLTAYVAITKADLPDDINTRELPELCKLRAVTGNCRGYFPKFYFNENSGECEQFIYGGCGGNDNRFDTKIECEGTCKVKPEPKSENICLLQPDRGFCKAYMPSYFYNVTSAKCERFIYGGCNGNANRFGTKKDCRKNCPTNNLPSPENICLLQPQTGPCDAIHPRFFYNLTTRECERFTYGGCQGNDNRFKTKKACQKKCQETTTGFINICDLAPDSGPCKAAIPQYFYNSTSGMCETFTYGGCDGNENRFETEEDCLGNCCTSSN